MRKRLAKWTIAAFVLGTTGLSVTACRAEDNFLVQFFQRVDRAIESGRQGDKVSAQPQRVSRQRSWDPDEQDYVRPRVYIVTPRSSRSSSPEQSQSSRQAFCVRTCDGRFFPVAAQDDRKRSVSCADLCPASETNVYYGSSINDAVGENGRRYSEMPNAFKFRNELVAGCTCNGSATGLAPLKVENDPTLRKGDIVATGDGLMVTRGPDRRGTSFAFSPVSAAIRAQFQRPPIVAAQ